MKMNEKENKEPRGKQPQSWFFEKTTTIDKLPS